MKEDNPLDVSTKENHAVWLCKQHNMFNKDLGKPEFPCVWTDIKKRWGPGSGV